MSLLASNYHKDEDKCLRLFKKHLKSVILFFLFFYEKNDAINFVSMDEIL